MGLDELFHHRHFPCNVYYSCSRQEFVQRASSFTLPCAVDAEGGLETAVCSEY